MNFLELAKQGDAKAIEALMNRHLQPKGITAKTDLNNGCLQVILESAQVPEQQAMVAFVHKGMSGLGVLSIHKVRVCGRQTDIAFTVWAQEFNLATAKLSNSSSTSSSPTYCNKLPKATKAQKLQQEQKAKAFVEASIAEQTVLHTKTTATEIKCSKCGSTQLTTNKKGFSLGKAAAGAIVLGPVGLVGGVWGSNQIMLTCLRCGHRWKPGKA